MNSNLVICIGRQYGSGGKEIGEKLAEKLGIPCYDKEILKKAAKDNGIVEELFEKADEQPTDSFLYSLSLGTHNPSVGMLGFSDYLTNDNIFIMTSKAINDLAIGSPCVIIGRCADYILQEMPHCLSVFIHADFDARV
ncbi:MAG: cytidylate kinase-like family protein, partial [Oscillospiraceae bacterium]